MKRILILIDYSSEFSRRLLKGLIQYSRDNTPWIFYRLSTYHKSLYGKEWGTAHMQLDELIM